MRFLWAVETNGKSRNLLRPASWVAMREQEREEEMESEGLKEEEEEEDKMEMEKEGGTRNG